MLILTRRINESIIIDNSIKVGVLGIKGSQVRLGIDAPKAVKVHREEIQDRINLEKQESTSDTQEKTNYNGSKRVGEVI